MEAAPKYPQASTYQHSTLPEPVSRETPLSNVTDTTKESFYHPTQVPVGHIYEQPRPNKSWIRWPFLLLAGLFIAVIAGLAGGFIGKAIEGSKAHNSNEAHASACSSAVPSPTSNSTASPTPEAIVVPKTGCTDTGGRTSSVNGNTFQTDFSNATYKLFCNVDWVGKDIASVYATSVSDCVETCDNVNQDNLINKTCIGATFVPAWVDRTLALRNVNRPSNCFLKYDAQGYPGNKREDEVVVACLEGKCPQG
ncbi:hypothetical protein BKA66DRAFT_568393 [Pyrenochaeta sp. MPI-SDFR-AT-0127]|nr:hypothetical protein BKA66DRAFT_568393 [Pyrenochaeta sp. MPI-SDFR-AT-0127]